MDTRHKKPAANTQKTDRNTIEMTITIGVHGNPRLHAAVNAAGPGKDAAALVKQLAEEALILREARAARLSLAPPGNHSTAQQPLDRESHSKHGIARGALDDQTLSAALDQFSNIAD
ncbi:MAG: hypothetical protein P4L87_10390 [Formivibrio sp.]|nr:hypothetical protein [Formivibrio sp.]